MKWIELMLVMLGLLVVSFVLTGCEDNTQQRLTEDEWRVKRFLEDAERYGINYPNNEPNKPVWGQGEITAEWQSFFGNDNMSRLNFAQTQKFNQLGQTVAELAHRVRKLEDPNEVKNAR